MKIGGRTYIVNANIRAIFGALTSRRLVAVLTSYILWRTLGWTNEPTNERTDVLNERITPFQLRWNGVNTVQRWRRGHICKTLRGHRCITTSSIVIDIADRAITQNNSALTIALYNAIIDLKGWYQATSVRHFFVVTASIECFFLYWTRQS